MRAFATTILVGVGILLIQLDLTSGEPRHEGPGWKLLHHRTGKWVERIAGMGPKKFEVENIQTGRWILDDRYLELRGKIKGSDRENLTLVTHDPKTKTFKMWYFDSGGGTSEWLGKLDASGTNIHWTGHISDGSTATATWTFTAKEGMEWESTVRDRSGKVVDHMEAKMKRMKK